MSDVSHTDYQVRIVTAKYSLSPHQLHHRPFILNEWGGNFEPEFCKSIEDKFNGSMPCITHSVVIHARLRISQILLTFNW